MKKLICDIKECIQKYETGEKYINCYLTGTVVGSSYITLHAAIQQREDCSNSGITLKITRTADGNFEVSKVEEF